MKYYRQEKPINYNFVSHFSRHVEQCVSTSRGKRPTKQWIQPLFQCHSKDPLRQKSSITLLSIQYGIYTLHDSTSLCSSAAVNMGNLTSILQVHRSAKVQYIVQNGLGQQKKSNSSLHCAPTKCCFCQFPIAIQKFSTKCFDRKFFWDTMYYLYKYCQMQIGDSTGYVMSVYNWRATYNIGKR